jgi:putative transposase
MENKGADDGPHSRALRNGRYSVPGRAYFITTNVLQREPLLTPAAREILIEALRWSRAQGRLRLLGYAVMDDHFHALVMLTDSHDLGRLLSSIKAFAARQINRLHGRTGPLWQTGYHDHAIRDSADFDHHLLYMHQNPVRRGLVEQPEAYVWCTAHPERAGDIDWEALGYKD